ncbi:MAG: hypothetical protein GXO73_08445 [Calditrichaeota bacterium]|nr:hypothetical protein [Calditrichota bacterium]
MTTCTSLTGWTDSFSSLRKMNRVQLKEFWAKCQVPVGARNVIFRHRGEGGRPLLTLILMHRKAPSRRRLSER